LCGHNAKEFDIPWQEEWLLTKYHYLTNWIYSARNHGKFRIWIRWNYGSLGLQALHFFKINVKYLVYLL
jgi:hypothetical protein